MPSWLRTLIALSIFAGGAFAGFSIGVAIMVASAIPDLAGGGHATGHPHTDYGVPGAWIGAIVGLASAVIMWRVTGKKGR